MAFNFKYKTIKLQVSNIDFVINIGASNCRVHHHCLYTSFRLHIHPFSGSPIALDERLYGGQIH